MNYALKDLTRTLCGSLDLYVLRVLTGEPDPAEISSSVLRWSRAVEFLRHYTGDMGALSIAQVLRRQHECPNTISVVNRRVVQLDGQLYSMDNCHQVSKDREDLKIILESHALNLAATEALIERDLRRAPRAGGVCAAPVRPAQGHPESLL